MLMASVLVWFCVFRGEFWLDQSGLGDPVRVDNLVHFIIQSATSLKQDPSIIACFVHSASAYSTLPT
jgi:hypothetical protein